MAITNKVTLTAVHDTDLKRVLIRLGLYKGILEGKYKCFVCGKVINLKNLGGIFKSKDGKIHIVCNDIKCILTAAEITSKISKTR